MDSSQIRARWARLAALLLALLATAAHGTTLQPPAADPDAVLVRELDEFARALVATGQVPGMALALTRGNLVLHQQGYGVRVAGAAPAVDPDTLFRIASVSKTFTSTLVGVLVERGYAQWEDPLPDLVPTFQLRDPAAAPSLTLEQLLSHRTGLPYHALDKLLEASSSPLDVLAQVPKVRLSCQPGDCYGYQNVAFAYAADAVFASSGSFFDVALRRELLAPLAMRRTSVGREAFMADENRALPHVWRASGATAVEPKPNYYWLPAAAGVNSSLRDMTRWLLAQQGYRPEVLDADLLATLHQPRVATPGEIAGSPWRRSRLLGASYALGFRVFDYQGHRMLFHAGAVEGFRAILAFAPDSQRGMVLMWNSNSGLPGGLLPYTFDHWFGLPRIDWLQLDQVRLLVAQQTLRQDRGRRVVRRH